MVLICESVSETPLTSNIYFMICVLYWILCGLLCERREDDGVVDDALEQGVHEGIVIDVVHDLVLCYAMGWSQYCSRKEVKEANMKYFSPCAIHDAKKILWMKYSDSLGPLRARRRSEMRPKHEFEVDGLQKLASEDSLPRFVLSSEELRATPPRPERNDPSEWKQQRPRNRPRRRTPLVGKADGAACNFRGAPPPLRHLFFSRVMKDVKGEDVKDHLKRCAPDIDVSSVECVSHANAKFKSFKLGCRLINEHFDPDKTATEIIPGAMCWMGVQDSPTKNQSES
ncbi:hypothetical protein CAPTEDRAFT_209881 [Capitella teleta]|uniref:Uncharacterized protein n=1 Tax=Capitella teleta TaxID=283909 RepID=R7UNV8_CAPTE|nr:hypothetical protein CAPTEDRAFT_209881 [Capitella teleta]|eukprot:ELU07910.1 hypothetical protein CAPTEDRAFT_209881 [Capitella teleta]